MNGSTTQSLTQEPYDAPLDKETIRLPDGRELTFYRFPEPTTAAAPTPARAKKKEP